MSRRTGAGRRRVGTASEPLQLLPARFVDAPPGQPEELVAALRVLFRDHLEERLDCGSDTSVNGGAMPGEDVE